MRYLQAVILDWAGTTIDHGSLAPVRALTEAFAELGIAVTDAEARRDMGLFKKDHIRNILAIQAVAAQWRERFGASPSEADVERLFTSFQPKQMAVLAEYAGVIDGVVEVCQRLRAEGLRIGGTTGYTRPMLDSLLPLAAAQGYQPDRSLCPDDVGGGRPHPWMCLDLALHFRVRAMAAVVKLGDTAVDVEEGRNAGVWTVGVAATGNEVGLGEAELAALSSSERASRIQHAREALLAAGAHYVINRVAECEAVLELIDARAARGERP